MDEIKKYIEEFYSKKDAEKKYSDYCDRYDDCFEAGVDAGYSRALYDIGTKLGLKLEPFNK